MQFLTKKTKSSVNGINQVETEQTQGVEINDFNASNYGIMPDIIDDDQTAYGPIFYDGNPNQNKNLINSNGTYEMPIVSKGSIQEHTPDQNKSNRDDNNPEKKSNEEQQRVFTLANLPAYGNSPLIFQSNNNIPNNNSSNSSSNNNIPNNNNISNNNIPNNNNISNNNNTNNNNDNLNNNNSNNYGGDLNISGNKAKVWKNALPLPKVLQNLKFTRLVTKQLTFSKKKNKDTLIENNTNLNKNPNTLERAPSLTRFRTKAFIKPNNEKKSYEIFYPELKIEKQIAQGHYGIVYK